MLHPPVPLALWPGFRALRPVTVGLLPAELREARAIVLVGFMGAFTTFSTFIFETGELLRDSQWALAIGNLAIQNITGVIFLILGLAIGRLL